MAKLEKKTGAEGLGCFVDPVDKCGIAVGAVLVGVSAQIHKHGLDAQMVETFLEVMVIAGQLP